MNPIFLLLFAILCSGGPDSAFVDGISTIKPGEELKSDASLVSEGGNFTLGFFTIKETSYSYIGIWYTNDDQRRKVWVANRNSPISDNSSVLTVDSTTGILKIISGGNTILNISDQVTGNNATATLEDTGNFVLTDWVEKRTLWQSFDHPTDTLLPGMKLGFNSATGKNWSLTSWLSASVPASGAFTLNWEPNQDSGELVMHRRGERYWTSGTLKDQTFKYMSALNMGMYFNLSYTSTNDEKYFTFNRISGSLWMLRLDSDGQIAEGLSRLRFGPFKFCYGYESDDGCVTSELPHCRRRNDNFTQKRVYFLPDITTRQDDDNSSLSFIDCMERCWNECNCVAFNVYSNGTGCITWTGRSEYKEDDVNIDPLYLLLRDPKSSKGKCIFLVICNS